LDKVSTVTLSPPSNRSNKNISELQINKNLLHKDSKIHSKNNNNNDFWDFDDKENCSYSSNSAS